VRPEKGQGAPGRRASLADTVREKLRSRPLTENINREQLVELGLHYLREADSIAGQSSDEATA
jgi:DNA repair protein SbcD/Mre11